MEQAIAAQNVKEVKKLLSKDKKKGKLVQRLNDKGQTALHLACCRHSIEVVTVLLKNNAEVNATDEIGDTPLHLATEYGTMEIIQILLSYNASPSIKNKLGNTPTHIFCFKRPPASALVEYQKLLELLCLENDCLTDTNKKGEALLHLACQGNNLIAVSWILRQSYDVNLTNIEGETALHYSVRVGSEKLVSILIRAGAKPEISGTNGTAHDLALTCNPGIANLLEELTAHVAKGEHKVFINGKEVTWDMLKDYKKRFIIKIDDIRKRKEALTNQKQKGDVTALIRELDEELESNLYLYHIIGINLLALEREQNIQKSNKMWSGVLIHNKRGSTEEGSEFFVKVQNGDITMKKGGAENFFIGFCVDDEDNVDYLNLTDTNYSLKVYKQEKTTFSITRYGKDSVQEEDVYTAEDESSLEKCLKALVIATRHPIEYIDGNQLIILIDPICPLQVNRRKTNSALPLIRGLMKNGEHSKSASLVLRTKSDTRKSINNVQFMKPPSGATFVEAPRSMEQPKISKNEEVSEDGKILSTNFSSFIYCEIFEKVDMCQLNPAEAHSYVLNGGTLQDLVLYLILHCHPSLFKDTTDYDSFFLSYPHFSKNPKDLIAAFTKAGPLSKETRWPEPYKSVVPSSRLFHFLSRFAHAPFVMEDMRKELKFRRELIEVYQTLVPDPPEGETIKELKSKLRATTKVQKLILSRQSSAPIQLEKEIPKLDILGVDEEAFASQIVLIQSNLYCNLRVNEILELRYSKNKEFSVTLNKLHDFSNKIYLLVPTTILEPDDPLDQVNILKKWISICERIFKMRDYNSAVQIVNGITEASVIRLKHLKEGLSTKWIERFDKMRLAFESSENYKAYRQLPMNSPCIPFIGVSLKDLTYIYDGNPDTLAEDDVINFNKMRMIHNTIKGCMLENPSGVHYELEPNLIQIEVIDAKKPMTQDQLFERSKQVQQSLLAKSEDCQDLPLLKREIKNLRTELSTMRETISKCNTEIEKKDKRIKKLEEKLFNHGSVDTRRHRFKKKGIYQKSERTIGNPIPNHLMERRRSLSTPDENPIESGTDSVGSDSESCVDEYSDSEYLSQLTKEQLLSLLKDSYVTPPNSSRLVSRRSSTKITL